MKYWAKTKKGGFEINAASIPEAWAIAKKEEKEINDARKEIDFRLPTCKVTRILKYENK